MVAVVGVGGRDPCPLLSALGRGGGAVAFCPSFELCWEFRGVAFECETTKNSERLKFFVGNNERVTQMHPHSIRGQKIPLLDVFLWEHEGKLTRALGFGEQI